VQTARAVATVTLANPCPPKPSCNTPDQTSSTPTRSSSSPKGSARSSTSARTYITTLVHVFGPVATVAAVGSRGRATRTVQLGERLGTEFPVEVPTHVSCIAQFEGGGVSQSVFSFQSPLIPMGVVDVTFIVPDPNIFTGEVKIMRAVPTRGDRPGSGVGDRPAQALSQDGEWGAGHGAIDPLQDAAHRIR